MFPDSPRILKASGSNEDRVETSTGSKDWAAPVNEDDGQDGLKDTCPRRSAITE